MSTPDSNLFHAAVMQSWNAIVITSADHAAGYPVLIANPAFCKMTGYTLDELKGCSLKVLQGPETDPAVIEELRACLTEGRFFEGTAINYRKDGTTYVVHWNITPIRDTDGVITHFVSVQEDISAYVRASRENRLLARALDASGDPIMVTDAQERILFANAAFSKTTGYPAEDLIGSTPSLLRSGRHDPEFYTALRRALASGRDFRATFINRRRDGSLYHADQSISPIVDDAGQTTHYVCVSRDVTDQVDREEALLEAATRDALTGLYNRRYGDQRLDDALERAEALGHPLSLILADIDHFKQINDRYGHPAGDRALEEVGRILRQSVRGRDAVIRWGGEEFMIVLEDCPLQPATELAERIRLKVSEYRDATFGGLTLSLGLATFAADEPRKRLVARADAALYDAKHAGRNRISVAAPPRAASG